MLALKKRPSGDGAVKLYRQRMTAQLEMSGDDPMINRVLPAIDLYSSHLKGQILDVGCYTGFLYHYLGKPSGYTGIDVTPEAIEVAKEFAPEADFRVQDIFSMKGEFDVLWCSQIVFGNDVNSGRTLMDAVQATEGLARKRIFVVIDKDVPSDWESKIAKVGQLNVLSIGG